MAKNKITEDFIRLNIDVKTVKAQQEIHQLEKATANLRYENKQCLDKIHDIESAEGKQSQRAKELRKQYNERAKSISENTKKIAELTKELDINALTMNQLRKEARQLQRQLDDTSQSLDPDAYSELEKRLAQVKERIQDLTRHAKTLKDTALSNSTRGFLWGTAFVKAGEIAIDMMGNVKDSITDTISQSIEMAQQADGISHAFDQLNRPDLLDNLRKATKGTVTDLELMKAAVKAKDFRIPLDDLGKYLAFAQLKAQQTGQSLDYMVESIVTGLGRQSPQILDNLGLSASEIKEQTKQTGDFMQAVANIVENNLAEAGETYVSAADRAAQRTTALVNAQQALGKALLPIKEEVDEVYGEWQVSLINLVKYLATHRDSVVNVAKVVATLTAAYIAYIAQQKIAHLWSLRHIAANKIRMAQETAQATLIGISTLRQKVLNGEMKRTVALQKALNLVMKASPWGLVIAGITAIATALLLFNKRTDAAAKAEKALNDIRRDAIGRMAEEKVKVDTLRSAAQDERLSLEERYRAIAQLNQIIPGYNAHLDATTGKYVENKKALDDYIASLTRKYEIEGAKEKLEDIGKQRFELEMEKAEEQENLKETRKRQSQRPRGPQTTSGAMPAATVYETATISAETKAIETRISSIDKKMKVLDTVVERIDKVYGEDIRRTAVKGTGNGDGNNGNNNGSDGKAHSTHSPHSSHTPQSSSSPRQDALAAEQASYQASLQALRKSLADKELTQQEYDAAVLAAATASAENRLKVEREYLQEAQQMEGVDAQEKERRVKEQQRNVAQAEQAAAEARLRQYEQYQKQMEAIERQSESPEERQTRDHLLQLQALQAYYKAARQYAIDHNEDVAAIDEAYRKAQERMVMEYEQSLEQKKMQVRQQYGLATQQQIFDQEMAQLRAQYDQKLLTEEQFQRAKQALQQKYDDQNLQLRQQYGIATQAEARERERQQLEQQHEEGKLSEEEYQQSLKQLRMNYMKADFDQYAQLFGGAIQALQDAELANIDAKYDAEIEAARQAGEDTTDLENKKANEKLKVQKKYADVNFAIKASQIIADTAVAIMKALGELGPIAGPIAAALMGVTGAAQLAAANAERQKVKNMTLAGATSSGATARVATGLQRGGRLAEEAESPEYPDYPEYPEYPEHPEHPEYPEYPEYPEHPGKPVTASGTIPITRAQDGKLFQAREEPGRRGYVDRPTVIVGDGPIGQSKEWVASNAALDNPTVAPVIDIIDHAQQTGSIATLDMRKYIQAKDIIGRERGGYLGGRNGVNGIHGINGKRPSSPSSPSSPSNPSSPSSPSSPYTPPIDLAPLDRLADILEQGIPAIVALDEIDAQQQRRNQARKIAGK